MWLDQLETGRWLHDDRTQTTFFSVGVIRSLFWLLLATFISALDDPCSPFGFTYACFIVCSQERRAFLTKVLVQVCHPLIWIPVLSTVIFCVGFTRRCKTSRNWSSLFWLVLLITNNDSFLLIPSNIGVVGL